jgi:hypothetical protein
VTFDLLADGTLRSFLDCVETMAAPDSSISSGPITLQFYRPGNIDNVKVSALGPLAPTVTPTPVLTPTLRGTPASPAGAIPTLSGVGPLILAVALAGASLLVLRHSSG